MWHQMWGWDGGWGMGMGWGWFGLVHVLWWAALVLGLVALVRWSAGGRRSRPRTDSALQILRERYARGEIDKGEFDERAGHLKG